MRTTAGKTNRLLAAAVAILTGAGLLGAADAAALVLVDNGQAKARIYVTGPILDSDQLRPIDMRSLRRARRRNPDEAPSDAVLAMSVAADELVYHLQKMSGATLDIVATDNPADVEAPGIVLGDLAVSMGAKPTETSESQEGFRIVSRDGLVLVGGQSEEAVRHGTYALLRRLGCDWIMPGEIGEVIPSRKTVEVEALDVSDAPDFLFRRLWYRGYPQPRLQEERQRFRRWLWRHQAGSWQPPQRGVRGHGWHPFIRRHQKVFEENPEMYALVRNAEGRLVRKGPQLESTHPKVVDLFVQEIKETYEKKIEAGEWTKDTKAGFAIGPSDGGGYSLSPEALAAGSGRMDPIIGEPDRTDNLILMGNRILERVTKEYPNAHVGCYSYSVHADYPARYKPHPNIAQIFAPISFSRFHSVLDDRSKTQAYYREVVKLWGELHREQGNILWYRGYNWNLAENMLPYTKVHIWGEELPFYKEQGIIGLNVEGTKQWGVLAPSDYVFMRMGWDTGLDWSELLHDFCTRAFGPAAEPMEAYQRRLIKRQREAGMEAGSYHAFDLIYDSEWVAESQGLFDRALQLAETDAQRTRVEYFRVGMHLLETFLEYKQAAADFDFQTAKEKYDALIDTWTNAYETNSDIVANEAPHYLKRFLARFVEQALEYSSGVYRIVQPLPDKLKTMFDPNVAGERMNYHHPAINDRRFTTTLTHSSTWDAQGLTGIRSGAVWYRWHFTLPEDLDGDAIGLFIGGVEDEARVWINGEAVGTSGRGFSVPFVYDLTDGIDYDGDNLLAIQVIRNSKLNEIGLGGIIRPSFLFTGPRLEREAPKQFRRGRVLPGGGLEDADERQ